MNTQGPFDGHGYTVHRDEPKTNGAGYTQQEENNETNETSKDNGSNDEQEKGHHARGPNHTWEDPDLSILDDRRGELPKFPIDILSGPCQEWVKNATHGASTTPAHVAVPFLGIASSLIGTARRVMASRSWTQPMTIWAAVVGFSGTGKTPGLDATKRALLQIERARKSEINELRRLHESRAEAAKAAKAQWKKEVKRAAEEKVVRLNEYRDKLASEPVMPAAAADPGRFIVPRLYVSNATIERLADLLQARPQGMLMLCDGTGGPLPQHESVFARAGQ